MHIVPNVGEFCLVAIHSVPGSISVIVGITGLTDGHAEIGRPAGYVSNIGQAPSGGVKWSDTPDPAAAAAYGTGETTSDFAAGDGGRLYLHLTHEGTTHTRFVPIRQAVAPAVLTVPLVSGAATEGDVLTGTAATFSGPGLVVTHAWEDSANGATGWSTTGTSGLASPALAAGRHYRLRAVATNTRGSVQAVSTPVGPVQIDLPSSPSTTVQSVAVGLLGNQSLPVTITASGVQNGDVILWSLAPAGGGASVANNNAAPVLWPGAMVELPAGIARGQYVLRVAVGDSAPLTSASFMVDTVTPSLTAPTASATADAITWSVTTTEAQGTIHAALRLAATAVGGAQAIIDGTGYIATSRLETPTASSANTGGFPGLAAEQYAVDIVHADDFGNISPVVSAGARVTFGSGPAFADSFDTYVAGQSLVSQNPGYTVFTGNSPVVLAGGIVQSTGSYDAVRHATVLTGATYSAEITVEDTGPDVRVYLDVENADNTYYFAVFASGNCRLVLRNAGVETRASTTIAPLAKGDVVKLERTGSAVIAYVNGIEIRRMTSTVFTTGRAGFLLFNTGSISNFVLN